MKTQSKNLTPQEADAFGRELDTLRQEVVADLGERDVAHIRRIIRTANRSEAVGRLLLHFGFGPMSFALGTTALGLSKILENMEIGHNIMHGQYDWTGDPALDSHRYEWDNVCTSADWRHAHNFEHHTYTNILGKDRDVGYSLLRVTPEQRWHWRYLLQPISAGALALLFQWGVGTHDLRIEDVSRGKQTPAELKKRALPFVKKAGWQLFKDYVFFPALALGNAPRVLLANFFANGIRNVWAFAVIFCGHFPEGVRVYGEAETEHESRGQWYVRQLNGSANIEGKRWLHVLTGHLSHQIEHHLFPDIPASRYPEMAPRVQEICARYGQSYNAGSFRRQLSSVIGRILRLSLPGPSLAAKPARATSRRATTTDAVANAGASGQHAAA